MILEKQKDQNYELIFVDNGGAEGEFMPLKPFIDTYVRLNTNTGAYLARNIGSVFAKAPILLFLEDDGIPENNLVEAHLAAHRKYDVIAVRGVYSPKTENPLNRMADHYRVGDVPYPYPSNLEGNSSYRSDVFYTAGGWDDDIVFGYGGRELSLRLLSVDPDQRKQIYSPEPIIYHDFATDVAHLKSKQEKQAASLKRLREKYPEWDAIMNSWRKFVNRYDLLIMRDHPYDINELEHLIHEKRYEEALSYLGKILKENVQDASIHNIMGVVCLQSGQKGPAMEHFQAAVSLEPRNATYQKNLASLYVDQNKLKQAFHIYHYIRKLYPEDTDSLIALASFYCLINRFDEAIKLFDAALSVDPENNLARQKLDEIEMYRVLTHENSLLGHGASGKKTVVGKGPLFDALQYYEQGNILHAEELIADYIICMKESIR